MVQQKLSWNQNLWYPVITRCLGTWAQGWNDRTYQPSSQTPRWPSSVHLCTSLHIVHKPSKDISIQSLFCHYAPSSICSQIITYPPLIHPYAYMIQCTTVISPWMMTTHCYFSPAAAGNPGWDAEQGLPLRSSYGRRIAPSRNQLAVLVQWKQLPVFFLQSYCIHALCTAKITILNRKTTQNWVSSSVVYHCPHFISLSTGIPD